MIKITGCSLGDDEFNKFVVHVECNLLANSTNTISRKDIVDAAIKYNDPNNIIFDTVFPVEVKSDNKFKFRTRWDYDKYKKTWYKWINTLCKAPKEKVTEKRRIVIIRYLGKGQRKFDPANLKGGCKPIPDALKHIGLIVDDNDKWLTYEYLQVKKKNCAGTRIILMKEVF